MKEEEVMWMFCGSKRLAGGEMITCWECNKCGERMSHKEDLITAGVFQGCSSMVDVENILDRYFPCWGCGRKEDGLKKVEMWKSVDGELYETREEAVRADEEHLLYELIVGKDVMTCGGFDLEKIVKVVVDQKKEVITLLGGEV
jgi:hypothetical protein